MKTITALLFLLFIPIAACANEADTGDPSLNPVDIQEWPVPYKGRPRDPFVAGDDTVWFVGQAGHYLGRFTPSTETFFKYDLEDQPGPHNLIVSSAGIVWYAGNLKGYIGRYDPETNQLSKIQMPDPAAEDPHTLVFDQDERHIWFTVQGGNFIGRLNTADSKVDLIPVPTPRARPYGIRLAPDGTPWIVLLGTNKLARVDPSTLTITEISIPNQDARPRRLEITDDLRVWYADYAAGVLGMYDPEAEVFKEWSLPGGEGARPYGTALDQRGRVWLVTGTRPNYFVGFDTQAEKIASITAIPSGGGTVRHMDYHPATDTVWFGTDTQNLGRAKVGIEAR